MHRPDKHAMGNSMLSKEKYKEAKLINWKQVEVIKTGAMYAVEPQTAIIFFYLMNYYIIV